MPWARLGIPENLQKGFIVLAMLLFFSLTNIIIITTNCLINLYPPPWPLKGLWFVEVSDRTPWVSLLSETFFAKSFTFYRAISPLFKSFLPIQIFYRGKTSLFQRIVLTNIDRVCTKDIR